MRPPSYSRLVSRWTLASFIAAMVVLTVTGCVTSTPGLVLHSFEFSAVNDSPDIEVLDYRYGDSKQPGSSTPRWRVDRGEISTGGGTYGEMRQGFDLYVKWRIKSTGEILEDTANLRSRMPRDIANHRVYFIRKNRQLWVYLITPEKRGPSEPFSGLRKYSIFKITTLYPL